MNEFVQNVGVVDSRFLAGSVGLLNPPMPLSIPVDATVEATVEKLKENKIGCVVVTARDETLSGIFTERDLLFKIGLGCGEISKEPIANYMTADPSTIAMTTPLAFALQMMSEGGFRHLPIVDEDNCPIGIISLKDIVDFIVGGIRRDLDVAAEL